MPLRPLGLLRLPHRDRTPDKEDHSLLNVRAADVTSAVSSSTSQPVSREPQFHERRSDDLLTTGFDGPHFTQRGTHIECRLTAKNVGGKGSGPGILSGKRDCLRYRPSGPPEPFRSERSRISLFIGHVHAETIPS